jgi:hypothetical protein
MFGEMYKTFAQFNQKRKGKNRYIWWKKNPKKKQKKENKRRALDKVTQKKPIN